MMNWMKHWTEVDHELEDLVAQSDDDLDEIDNGEETDKEDHE